MQRVVPTIFGLACVFAVACGGASPSDEAPIAPQRPAEGTQASPPPPAPVEVAPPAPSGKPIVAPERKWTWVPIPGARCMDGSATGIGVNLSSSSSDVAIVLEGGGACFDDATCAGGTIHTDGFDQTTFSVVMGGMGFTGILNRNLPHNPLKDFNYVFVPYCTGDVHAGNNPSGPKGRRHVGFENVRVALERIVPTFPSAKRVVLTGSSAGGIGAAYNFDQVQRAFGATPVILLDDSGPVLPDQYLKPCVQKKFRQAWNLDDTMPRDCADCRNPDGGGLINVARHLARKYPKSRFGMISSTADAVIRGFFSFGYSRDCSSLSYFPARDFEAGLMDLRAIGAAEHSAFHVFYPRSEMHTWLLTDAGLSMRVSGVSLHEWIRGLIDGSPSWEDAVP